MGRRAIDRLSQERLVYELRVAIDRCVRRPWDTRARGALRRLLADNPRSATSTHVTYNLGKTRAGWLRQFAATDARSSLVTDEVAQEESMVRDNPELQKQERPPYLPPPLDIKEDRTPEQMRRDEQPRVIKGDAAPTTKKGS